VADLATLCPGGSQIPLKSISMELPTHINLSTLRDKLNVCFQHLSKGLVAGKKSDLNRREYHELGEVISCARADVLRCFIIENIDNMHMHPQHLMVILTDVYVKHILKRGNGEAMDYSEGLYMDLNGSKYAHLHDTVVHTISSPGRDLRVELLYESQGRDRRRIRRFELRVNSMCGWDIERWNNAEWSTPPSFTAHMPEVHMGLSGQCGFHARWHCKDFNLKKFESGFHGPWHWDDFSRRDRKCGENWPLGWGGPTPFEYNTEIEDWSEKALQTEQARIVLDTVKAEDEFLLTWLCICHYKGEIAKDCTEMIWEYVKATHTDSVQRVLYTNFYRHLVPLYPTLTQ
jgi:hypothetical protein